MPRVCVARNPHRVLRSPHLRGTADSTSESSDDDDYRPETTTSTTTSTTTATTLVIRPTAPTQFPEESFESPPDAVIRRSRQRRAAAISGVSPLEVVAKRKRPIRAPKSSLTLAERLAKTELTHVRVAEIIEALYEEQEQDDREMYNITTQLVREKTKCELSSVVDELGTIEFRRMLTYGEVSVASIASTVLPLLRLEADDVFFDLGCGTGKIVVQVALQSPCMVAKGIELMENRVLEGAKALARLENMRLPMLNDKDIKIIQGDILKPPETAKVLDATVVFINNVCFGPELMLEVLGLLERMPKLRRIVTLRKICERHRPQKCGRAQNYCVDYVHPPEEAEINVSWAHKTSVYVYERVNYSLASLAQQFQVPCPVDNPPANGA